MADIVGLVASVLQLFEAVARARDYIHDFRHAPKEQEQLSLEIQNLEPLVRELENQIKNGRETRSIGSMLNFEQPLIQLKGVMERLVKKLDQAGAKVTGRLTWPLWGKDDVQEELSTVERFKALLNAWLGMDNW
jgi:hypothetical protein